MTWLYVPGLAVSNSVCEWPSQIREPCVTWKGKPMRPQSWRRAWKKEPWLRLLSGPMLPPSVACRGVESLISSLRVTRANPSRAPASARAPTTSGGSGMKSGASFAKFDHGSFSWRTSQGTFLGRSDEYSETWPRAGGVSNGTAYQRVPSAPLTSVIGCSSLLPAPSATSYGSGQNGKRRDGSRYRQAGKLGLSSKAGLLPTPLAAGNFNRAGASPQSGDGLSTAVTGGDKTRRLSPLFVEWMMGWPRGWTHIECEHVATESCRKLRRSRSRNSKSA